MTPEPQGGPVCRFELPGRRSQQRPSQPVVYQGMPLVPGTPVGFKASQPVHPTGSCQTSIVLDHVTKVTLRSRLDLQCSS